MLGLVIDCKVIQFTIKVSNQVGAQQINVDIAGPENSTCILIFQQTQQQMLEGRIFVVPAIGLIEGPVQ